MYPKKSIGYICSLFGKTPQAWYDSQRRKQQRQMQDVLVLSWIKQIRTEHKQMGTKKLLIKLSDNFKQHDIHLGRDKLHQLISSHGLLVRQRKYKARTTNSNHPYHKYSNQVRDLQLSAACQLWASDITYLRVGSGFAYLSLVTDCYSHKIVGWCLWPNLKSQGALNALRMALKDNTERATLIHHSDRGIQYCCEDYVRELNNNKIVISMTENGDPYENALAERVNGILKSEYDLNMTFTDYTRAQAMVKRAVELYNTSRPHSSCDNLTPEQAHSRTGKLTNHWKRTKVVEMNG